MNFNILMYILIALVSVLIVLVLKKKSNTRVDSYSPPPVTTSIVKFTENGRTTKRYVAIQYSSDRNSITYSDCLKSGLHTVTIKDANVTQTYALEYIKASNNAWYQHGTTLVKEDT